jgi:hypothetical protein
MVADLPLGTAPTGREYLSALFGTAMSVVDISFLEGGVLSDAYRVRLEARDGDAGVPASVVVKLPSSSDERRQNAIDVNAYTKELNFYGQLADDVPIASPKIYACATDGADAVGDFVLVMEDLTAHSKVFDQVEDPPDEVFARRIALEAAKLHAAYWESSVIRLPWVGRPDGRYVFSLDPLCRTAPTNLPVFRELWHTMYGVDLFAGRPEMKTLTALLCGPDCDRIHDRIYDTLSSRPHTLLHGDMRADNVFRTVAPASLDRPRLTFIDWQVIHAGPPGPELTQAFMHSLEPDVRRKDRDILGQYHHELLALNPAAAAYTYEMLVEDYTLAYCFWWTAIISLGVGTLTNFDRPEGARMKRLWDRGMARLVTAMSDLDCLSRVRALLTG